MMRLLYVLIIALIKIEQITASETIMPHVFVPKMDHREREPSCRCNQTLDSGQLEVECKCSAADLLDVPRNLTPSLSKLTIMNSNIKSIKSDSFRNYRRTLKDVTLANLPYLCEIEGGSFANIPNLRTLYIINATQIKYLNGLLAGVTSTKFYSLRIMQTSLIEVPNFAHLPKSNVISLLDLDLNKIEKLSANSIKIAADQVTLNYNDISIVENHAFNGSQISKLNLRGNKMLTKLEANAFAGLASLSELDLSGTSIETIPVIGLNELEKLRIEETPTMKTIPSIFDLENLQFASLTHSFHCCAFKYPEQHDPQRYARHQEEMRKKCENFDTGQHVLQKRQADENQTDIWGYKTLKKHPLHDFAPHPKPKAESADLNPLIGTVIEHEAPKPIESDDDDGTFHDTSVLPNATTALCGILSRRHVDVKCYPEPNALNPCEDIMGYMLLRVSVWFVVILAILGNLAVMVVVVLSRGELTVSKFLIVNLAFADFSMGLYLLLIASMDLHSVGVYFNVAYLWQYGLGCKIAGFLTVFGSHLSVFTLTIVTIERWFAITYAIHLTKRITLRGAIQIMLGGWFYSILLAALPLFGISNYGSTSICLPMEINRIADTAYLYILILTNGLAFAIIVFCYTQIYLSLGRETRRSRYAGEMTIAKKMALLIFTDFATWAPISFFSLTALAGCPLIGVTKSKILLVFFYPINACANPYLYAIMTAQYRKEFFVLLSRCGFCKNLARRYSEALGTPTTNMRAIPLIARSNGHELLVAGATDDTFV